MNGFVISQSSALTLRPIASAVEYRQFSDLLDLAFELPAGSRFFDDFPIWEKMRGQPALRAMGFYAPKIGLVAAAAARTARLNLGAFLENLPVGIIGGVATHPDWRGQGLATRLVENLVNKLAVQKVSLAVLWGSEHEFYRRLGFALCGRQMIVPLNQISHPVIKQKNEVYRCWCPAIFDQMRARVGGLILNEEDRFWIAAHKNVKWYWTGPKQRPLAYAGFGRGIDLNYLVHEWGGEKDSLQQILAVISEEHPGAALLGAPEILGQYSLNQGILPQLEALCMAKVLDPRAFQSFEVTEVGLAEKLFGCGSRGKPMFPLWFWGLDSA